MAKLTATIKITAVLLVFGLLSYNSTVEALSNHANANADRRYDQAIQILEQAEQNTDIKTQERMKQDAIRANRSMGRSDRQTVFLTCAVGHAALVFGARIGICYDNNRNFHTLMGANAGFSLGAKTSLVFGIVRTSNGHIGGRYRTFSNASSGTTVINAQGLTQPTLGFGHDVLAGRGFESAQGNTVVLVGPAYGFMGDFSYQVFTLD